MKEIMMKAGIVACMLAMVASMAQATTREVLVRSSDIRLTRPSDGATVVEVTLPEELRSQRIEYATLEFYVASVATDDSARPCVIRFGPVTSVSETDFTTAEGRWAGDLMICDGTTQRVMLNVTSVLRAWVAGQGNAFGALAARDIDGAVGITVGTDGLGTGVVGRLRVWVAPEL